uniref:Uncharacterized protein n=1 Tax=Arundo donax TaxID=35708 RepID=A0A0A9FF80_ARUDO
MQAATPGFGAVMCTPSRRSRRGSGLRYELFAEPPELLIKGWAVTSVTYLPSCT